MLPENLIATYHYVRPRNSDGVTGLTPDAFERQIEAIAAAYTPVPVGEFIARSSSERGLALITFDDAVADQYNYAAPILERRGVPAVFYAPMRPFDPAFDDRPDAQWISQHLLHALAQTLGWAGLEQRFYALLAGLGIRPQIDHAHMNALYHYEVSYKRRLKYTIAFALAPDTVGEVLREINREAGLRARDWFMTRSQLVELQARGFDLGGHGFDHLPYSTLKPREQEADLRRSRDVMDTIAGTRPRSLAYPFGRSTAQTELIARGLGYTRCFGTEERTDAKDIEAVLAGERAAA